MSINVSMSTYNGHLQSPLMSVLQAKETGRDESFALAGLWPVLTEILILLKQNSIYFSKVIIWLFELWIWRLVWSVPRICEGEGNSTPPHQALCEWLHRAGWSSSWDGYLAVMVTRDTACACCQPWPDTFVFEREAAVVWLLLRTVEEPLGKIFKVFDSGFVKINKKIPSAPMEGRFKDLMTLGRALKRPLCFYPSRIFKFIC